MRTQTGVAILAPAPEALAALDAGFPGWHAWTSSTGRWWATRTGGTAAWKAVGLPMTVDADDEAGLRAELAALPLPADVTQAEGHSLR